MTVEEIEDTLSCVTRTWCRRDPASIREELRLRKRDRVAAADEDGAKHIWCLEQVLTQQTEYISAFAYMKLDRLYPAWCALEQAELAAGFVLPHLQQPEDSFHVRSIDGVVRRFQSLFPYAYFMSTEFIRERVACSTCGELRVPRGGCRHRKGEIYGGEMCCDVVQHAELVGIALVEKPTHKYAVPMKTDSAGNSVDQYDYSAVQHVIARLRSPFDEWTVNWRTDIRPLRADERPGRNSICPCGWRRKYKACCLGKGGIQRPHAEVVFAGTGAVVEDDPRYWRGHISGNIASDGN